jgi:hypothetical protein
MIGTSPLRERFTSRDVSVVATRRVLVPVCLGATAIAFLIPLLLSPEAMPRPDPLTVEALVGLFAVSLTAGLIAASWVWAEAAIARWWGQTDLAVFVSIYAVGGAVVGLVLFCLLPIVGFVGRAPAVIPVFGMAVLAAWTALLIGAVLDGRRRLIDARTALVEQATAVALTSESQSAFIEGLRRQLSAEVEGSLRPTFERTAERLEFEARFAQDRVATVAAQVLTELTEASVRPFSRVLDRRAEDRRDRRGPIAFIRGVARRQPFRPVPVALIFIVASMAEAWTGDTSVPTPIPVPASIALGVVLIFAILIPGNLLMRRWPRRHTKIFVSTFIVLQVPTVWWVAVTQSLSAPSVIAELVVMILISACVVWLTSGFGRWRASQAELLAIYAEDLESARIDVLAQGEILRSLTKDAARALHGSVQSRLTACILALDRAAESDDLQAYAEAISEARAVLGDSWSVSPSQIEEVDIDALVGDKVGLWQGLAGITSYVDPSLRGYCGPAVMRVGDIVEEGLCNAVRHGAADSVSVQVDPVVEGHLHYIRIRVVDDGSGPGEWTAGLGTVYVDEACRGRWSLGVSPSGGGLLDAWVLVEPEPV